MSVNYPNNWPLLAVNTTRCFTCLSVDRALTPLKDKAIMTQVCPEIFSNVMWSACYMICWECNTVIRKIKHFRSQVLKAQDILKRTVTDNSVFTGLSNLNITGIVTVSLSPQTTTIQNSKSPMILGPNIPDSNIHTPSNPPPKISDPNIHPPNISDPNIHLSNILIKLDPDNGPVNIKNEITNNEIGDVDELIQQNTMWIKPNRSGKPTDMICESEMYDSDPLLSNIQNAPKIEKQDLEINWNPQEEKNEALNASDVKLNYKPEKVFIPIQTAPPREAKELVKVTVGGIIQQAVEANIQEVKEYAIVTLKDTKIDPKTQPIESIIDPTKIKEINKYSTIIPKETKTHPTMCVNERKRYPNTVIDISSQPQPVIENEVDPSELGIYGLDDEIIIKRVMLNENDMKKYREGKLNWIKGHKFLCEKCLERFNTQKNLDEHNIKHDLNRGKYVCEVCEQRFPSIDEKDEHYRNHFILYECLKCGAQNHDRRLAMGHYKRNHQIKRYTCRCGQVFETYMERNRHNLAVHSGAKVECPTCKKKVKKICLKSHMKIHDERESEIVWCTDCKIPFKNKYVYNWHIRNTQKHNTHDRFKCDDCGKWFTYKQALKEHFDAEHNNKKYTCDICQKVCLTKARLKRHKDRSHGDKHCKERTIMCDLCGKSYKNKHSLKSHMNIHQGARPYKCEDCGDTFSYHGSLYTHRRLKHKVKRKREMNN